MLPSLLESLQEHLSRLVLFTLSMTISAPRNYLAEIFTHLNSLNTSMQGREENILTSSDKLVAFKKKVEIWKNRAKDGNFEIFPLVRESCIRK